jgi:hypothetical protein
VDTVLAAVLTVGALTIGGIVTQSYRQEKFNGQVFEFMRATDLRLARIEKKGDTRDERDEQRRANGGYQ